MNRMDLTLERSEQYIGSLILMPRLSQTKCVWLTEQRLLLPRLEDSDRRKPVHCSWVSLPLFLFCHKFRSGWNFELSVTFSYCSALPHCMRSYEVIECYTSGMQSGTLLEKFLLKNILVFLFCYTISNERWRFYQVLLLSGSVLSPLV